MQNKNFFEKMYDEKVKRLGIKEVELRKEMNTASLATIIVFMFCFPLLFIFPPVVVAYPVLLIRLLYKYVVYLRKSEYTITGKKKRGR